MKVTLERVDLLRSLTHVHRVVERRNTIPILSNVLLKAADGSLRLKATDLDLEVVETVAAEVGEGGGTTVPAHMFYDIVRKLPDGSEISLESEPESGTLLIRAGRSRFQLQVLPENEFPDLTAGEFSHNFRMPANALKRLIERTQFAISTEETRYYLNGIFLHAVDTPAGPRLRAVATDGHRLAQAEYDAPAGAEDIPGIIIPRKTVSELQKLVEEPDTTIEVDVSESKIRIQIGAVVLTSKLIDGTFPDYGRVIPQHNDKVLEVDRDAFARAVDRVSTVSSERGRAVKLSIAEGRLVLSVTNPDSGSATEELGIDYEAEPIDIGFNSRYLLDITGQLEGDTAIVRLADPGSPTLIQDNDAADSLYVLMPMRV